MQRLAGLATAATLGFFRWLPSPLAWLACEIVAFGIFCFTLFHEWRIRYQPWGLVRNQRIVFRERWSRRFGARLAYAYCRHMARLALEFARMPRITPKNIHRYVDLEEAEIVRSLQNEGKGAVVVLGHIGNFDMAGHVAGCMGMPTTSVYRPIANESVHRVITAVRESGGQEVVSKWGVLRPLVRALRAGRLVGIALDENLWDGALFAPFLGTVAASNPSGALLHVRTGAPIVVVSCARRGWLRYKLHTWGVLRREPREDRQEEVRAVTEWINDTLSRSILAYPAQWFWGSQRFRHRPPRETIGLDRLPPRA